MELQTLFMLGKFHLNLFISWFQIARVTLYTFVEIIPTLLLTVEYATSTKLRRKNGSSYKSLNCEILINIYNNIIIMFL